MTALICGLWIWSPVVRVWCWKTRFQSYLNFFVIFKTVVYINKKKFQKNNTETSYILIFGQIILSLPGILRFWLLNMTVVMTSFEFRVSTIQKGGKAFITVRVLQWMNDLPVKTFRKGSICLSAVLDCILFMVFSHVFYFADQGFLVLTHPLSVYLSWKWAFYHEIYAIVEGSQGNSRFKSKWRFQKLSSEFNKHHMTKFFLNPEIPWVILTRENFKYRGKDSWLYLVFSYSCSYERFCQPRLSASWLWQILKTTWRNWVGNKAFNWTLFTP